MIKLKFKLADKFRNAGKRLKETYDNMVTMHVRNVVLSIHGTVHEITPVWSGRAVANYQWSNDTPFSGSISPIMVGPVGEGRRSMNKALSDQSLRGLNYYKKIYLINNAQYPDGNTFMDLEYGRLPTPQTSRVPAQGLMRIAFAANRHRNVTGFY